MRVLLRAPFDPVSRFGRDACDLAVQWDKLGVDVVPWPVAVAPGLPPEFTRLLAKPAKGDFDVVVGFGNSEPLDGYARKRVVWTREPVGVDADLVLSTTGDWGERQPTGVRTGLVPTRRREPPFTFGVVEDHPMVMEAWRSVYDSVDEFDPVLRVADPVQLAEDPTGWLSAVDVVLAWHDQWNRHTLEALATGATAIAAPVGEHRSWLHEQVAVPLDGSLADAIVWCWQNPQRVAELGMAASGYVVASLSWDKVALETAKRMERLVYA